MNVRVPSLNTARVLAALFILIVTASYTSHKTSPAGTLSEIRIGVLLPMNGAAASIGAAAQAAIELAEADVKARYSQDNPGISIKLIYKNTHGEPDSALKQLQALSTNGIKIFIGPLTSAEVEKVKPYADAHGLLVLSPTSRATSLSIPNDNIFRLSPDDDNQVKAYVALLGKNGIKYLITIYRDDVWGRDLSAATKKNFEAAGGTIILQWKYHSVTKDFKPLLSSIKADLSKTIARYGTKEVGIQFLSFAKVADAMKDASTDPVFSQVRWFGSSASALNSDLLKDPAAAAFAEKVQFTAPAPGYDESIKDKWEPLQQKVRERLKREPESHILACYDAVWIITKTLESTKGEFELNSFKTALASTADSYSGVSGQTKLNANGDRISTPYDYWQVVKEGGQYIWKKVGHYEE